jgi:hypothetical protein
VVGIGPVRSTVVGVAVALVALGCTAPSSPEVPARWTAAAGPFRSYVTNGDCPTTTSCFGLPATGGVLHWDGGSWAAVDLGPAGAPFASPVAVSCPDPATCFFGGSVPPADPDGSSRPSLVRWVDGTATEVPLGTAGEAGGMAVVEALSCPTASWCLVRLGDGNGAATLLRWDGTTVTAVPLPAGVTLTPATGGSFLAPRETISCGAPDRCMALATSVSVPGLVHWDGTLWAFSPVVDVAGGVGSARSVSCAGPSFCAALGLDWVGTAATAERHTTTVATWNGTRWSTFAAPGAPPDEADLPYDWVPMLSCASPRWCVAVGFDYGGSTSRQVTLVWTGAGWHRGPGREPDRAALGYIDCVPGTRWCMNQGTYAVADVFEATGEAPGEAAGG